MYLKELILSPEAGWYWFAFVLALKFTNSFLKNLMINMPSLKSNTPFELFYNSVDALVSTIKGFSFGKKPVVDTPSQEDT